MTIALTGAEPGAIASVLSSGVGDSGLPGGILGLGL